MSLAESAHPAATWDSRLADAVAIANVPTLQLVLVHLTGDMGWLEGEYAPRRGRGLDDNDSGGLPEARQAEIRAAAAAAIKDWRAGGADPATPAPEALARMLSASMAEPIGAEYGEIVAQEISDRTLRPRTLGQPEGFKVAIVGAGMSGICAAIHLQAAGIPFEILEAAGDFGGTWRENTYPGAGVDTPNHLYSFSFAQYDWSHYFALQGDLHAYFRKVAADFGLGAHTRFHTRVERAEWDAAAGRWRITTRGPEGAAVQEADALFSAVGVLTIPKVPPIPGLDGFPGPCFHTAEWPEGIDLKGKRVGIVGNGASAMQIVPAIAEEVAHLTVFARSKQWAAPFPKFREPVPEEIRWLIAEVPLYQKWYRQRLAWTFNDRVHASLQRDPDWEDAGRAINATNDSHRAAFIRYIRAELGDRQDLFDKVTPDFPPFGKRMLLDNGWYRTVAREDVTLVDQRLERVEGNVLVGADGSRHEVDVLILGTGFHATELLSSMEVRGEGGAALSETWDGDDARAYLGTAVPGFPNLFTLLGPNIGLGHGGSVITPVESQVHYILDLLQKTFAAGARTVEVRREVHDAYNAKVDAAHAAMVWTHPGMDNWYRNSKGRVVAITPWRHDDFWRMTRSADLADYVIGGGAAGGAAQG
ncbi:flavin-containing monooxygenase [Rhodovulum sp. DZ06]|uniref:flavin-containing monooxygenase n=1 Tax=Rhodovulum sp. DZ06 TaxID=3425126 RepID=UPI003D332E4A